MLTIQKRSRFDLFTKIVSFRHNSDAAAVVFVNLDIEKAALKSLESIFTEFLV